MKIQDFFIWYKVIESQYPVVAEYVWPITKSITNLMLYMFIFWGQNAPPWSLLKAFLEWSIKG